MAGITKDTPDPVDGVIVRDENGEPTGYLLEGAQGFGARLIPEPTEESLTRALQKSVDDLVIAWIDGGGDGRSWVLRGLSRIRCKRLKMSLVKRRNSVHICFVGHTVFEQMMEDKATYDEPWIEPGAMKFFIDGALGGKTALLSEPYADTPETVGHGSTYRRRN